MESIGKLLKIFSTGFKNPGVKLGYCGSLAGGIIVGIVCVIARQASLATYAALGPCLLFGFILYWNYEIGKNYLKRDT